jgi:hypothetical protein
VEHVAALKGNDDAAGGRDLALSDNLAVAHATNLILVNMLPALLTANLLFQEAVAVRDQNALTTFDQGNLWK